MTASATATPKKTKPLADSPPEARRSLTRFASTVRERLAMLPKKGASATTAEIANQVGPQLRNAAAVCDEHGIARHEWYAANHLGEWEVRLEAALAIRLEHEGQPAPRPVHGVDHPPAVRYVDMAPEEAVRLAQVVEQFDAYERTKLATATEGGRLLTEAQQKIGLCGWGQWLEAHFKKGRSTAANWQRLHRERDRIRKAIDAGEIRERVGEAVKLVAEKKRPSHVAVMRARVIDKDHLQAGEIDTFDHRLKAAKCGVEADKALKVLRALGITYGQFMDLLRNPRRK